MQAPVCTTLSVFFFLGKWNLALVPVFAGNIFYSLQVMMALLPPLPGATLALLGHFPLLHRTTVPMLPWRKRVEPWHLLIF